MSNTGLQTLATEGLNIAALDDGSACEMLHWHSAINLPDADQTVLLWVRYEDGETDWTAGWWDGEAWRLCESGCVCAGRVLHWAEPAGPAC